MSPEELIRALTLVFVVLLWRNANAQDYYDLYSNSVGFKTRDNEIHVLAAESFSSSATNNSTENNGGAVTTASTPTKSSQTLPRIATVVLLALVLGILLAIWHAHFMQQRRRLMLRRDFTMTEQDTQLSSTALSNDPLKRLSDCDDSFRIPMPDPIPPKICVTSPSPSNSNK